MLKGDTSQIVITDTAGAPAKKSTIPRKATFRSAVLPGWGQAYNHEYWKIPIVYGALAVPATLYVYNNTYYKRMKFAYEAVYAATLPTVKDSSMLRDVSSTVKTKAVIISACLPISLTAILLKETKITASLVFHFVGC